MTILTRNNVLKGVGFSLTLLAFLMGTVGLSTDYWAVVRVQHKQLDFTSDLNYGLIHIKSCPHDHPESKCTYRKLRALGGLEVDYFHGCLAAMCLGFIANVIATFAMGPWIAKIGSQRLQNWMHVLILVMQIFAAFWMCIAVAVFAAKDEEALLREPGMSAPGVTVDHKFGYSWGLSLFAVLLEIAAVVVVVFAKRKE